MSELKNYIFLGNCQAFNVASSSHFDGIKTQNIRCSTTLLHEKKSFKGAKEYLLQYMNEEKYKMLGFLGQIAVQPSPDEMRLDIADVIVVNMFPEDDCYIHKENGFVIKFHVEEINQVLPSFWPRVKNDFEKLRHLETDASYFKRFKNFLINLRKENTAAPVFIIKRLGLFPFFSPNPSSLLACWDSYWSVADDLLKDIKADIDGIHIVSLDHIVAKLFKSKQNCYTLLPRMSVCENYVNGRQVFSYNQNTEYLDKKVWDEVALEIIDTTENSLVRKINDKLPDIWMEINKDYIPPVSTIEKMIQSGSNLLFEKALSCLMMMYPINRSDLLLKYKKYINVDYRTFEALRKYSMLFPTNDIVQLFQFFEEQLLVACEENRQLNGHYRGLLKNMKRYTGYAQGKFGDLAGYSSIVLWGASGNGRSAVRIFKKLGIVNHLSGFVDSDESLSGKNIEGLSVYNPESLPKLSCDAIMITSAYQSEILNQLQSMSFKPKPDVIDFPKDLKTYISIHIEKTCGVDPDNLIQPYCNNELKFNEMQI